MNSSDRSSFANACRAGLAGVAMALLAGCATGETAYQSQAQQIGALQQARETLLRDLQDCSTRYGFNPNDPALPENTLGPNELEWRNCAYEAARDYTAVNTPLALDFATLIDEDQKMTQALAAGQITRSERRARLQPLIAAVHDKEMQQIEALEADQAKKDELVRRVTEGLRGFN